MLHRLIRENSHFQTLLWEDGWGVNYCSIAMIQTWRDKKSLKESKFQTEGTQPVYGKWHDLVGCHVLSRNCLDQHYSGTELASYTLTLEVNARHPAKPPISSLLNWIGKRKYNGRFMNWDKGRERSQIVMSKSCWAWGNLLNLLQIKIRVE